MKKGYVAMLKLGGKDGRSIYSFGEVVNENCVDNFDELVKTGRISLKDPRSKDQKTADDTKEKAKAQTKADAKEKAKVDAIAGAKKADENKEAK